MTRPTRIPALDGIRGLAIALVLWCHVMPGDLPRHPHLTWLVKIGRLSWSGVDLFFVLSGFLIGGILLDAVDSPHYFKTSYIRRAFRILPLYGVLLALAGAVERGASWLPRYALLLQNFWMAWMGVFGVYVLRITWSLAIEEQFYLTLPCVIRFTSRRTLTTVMIGAVLLAPVCRALAITLLPGKLLAAYVLMPCRMDALCLGVLIAITMRSPTASVFLSERRVWVYSAFAVVIAGGLIMLFITNDTLPRGFGFEYSFLAITYGLLLLSTLLSPRLSRTLSFRPLRFLGVIAYGVYLFHSTLIALCLKLAHADGGLVGTLAAGIGALLTIPWAALSWKYFEKPLVKRGHRYQYWDEPTQTDAQQRPKTSGSAVESQPLAPERLGNSF